MACVKTYKLLSLKNFVQCGGVLPGLLGMGISLFLMVPFASAQEMPCGVWVVRNALQSQAEWEATLNRVEALGCRRLYLQVSGRWDAYFPSAVFPGPERRHAGWIDPFGRAVTDAHARGLEVHAWINALLAWSAPEPPVDPEHVFVRHPDWFVADRQGRTIRERSRSELDRMGLVGEGWFLDPAVAEVRSELRRFVLELVTRYPVDGVHLDYIRYPTGWVPAEGGEAVTRLVALIRTDLQAVRSSAVLSAAVMPRPDVALASFGQDWGAWLGGGLVDEVVPMVYRDTPGQVLAVVRGYPSSLARRRIWVGVRIDRLDPREFLEAVSHLHGEGVAGTVLFSHNLMTENPAWRRVGRIASATLQEVGSAGLFDLAGPDATGADSDAPDGAAESGPDALEVRLEPAAGLVVGVANAVPRARRLTTDDADS